MRVIIATLAAAVATASMPADEATVPVVLSAAMPLVAGLLTWATRDRRSPRWLPRPVLLGDAVIAALVVLTAAPVRVAMAVMLLPLFVAGAVSSRLADLVLVTLLGTTAVVGLVGAPIPARGVLGVTVAVTAVAVAVQGRQLRRAVTGGSQRIAFLSGRSRALLQGVTEALLVTTPSGRILDGNQPAVDLAGGSGLVGRSCSDVLGLHRDHALLDCSRCPLAEEPGHDLEVWTEDGDGNRTTLLARVQPITNRHGRVIELLHSFRDVSEIARARDAENTFLATASHELKTPLTVIRGSAETLAARDELPAEVRDRLLTAIVGKSAELDVMIGRLLQASRLRAGITDVELADVEVTAVVGRQVDVLDRASPDHHLTWVADAPVPFAHADAEALAVVLDHLLENARKYSPDGGNIVTHVTHDDHDVVVEVTDHGIGMTVEQQRHCFDRFWQGRTGDRRRFGGTGVGLFLVRELVLAMGGRVVVTSQLGVGSTFTVRLPRVDAAARPAPEPVDEHGLSMIEEFMSQVGVTPGSPRPSQPDRTPS